MGKFVDLTGRKFERLTVIKRVDKPEGKREGSYWLCKCDCGKEIVVFNYYLTCGDTKSCGCLLHEHSYNFKDLTGQRFGKLLVIEQVDKSKGRKEKPSWICKCDCGNIKEISGEDLRREHSTSCGCSRLEKISLPFGQSGLNWIYADYKRKAPKRGYSFELSKDEFTKITKENCFYCGIPPSKKTKEKGYHGFYVYNGIDRVDNTKGYILGNVVACCLTCNIAKHEMTEKDFLNWVERVYNHSIKDKNNGRNF